MNFDESHYPALFESGWSIFFRYAVMCCIVLVASCLSRLWVRGGRR